MAYPEGGPGAPPTQEPSRGKCLQNRGEIKERKKEEGKKRKEIKRGKEKGERKGKKKEEKAGRKEDTEKEGNTKREGER